MLCQRRNNGFDHYIESDLETRRRKTAYVEEKMIIIKAEIMNLIAFYVAIRHHWQGRREPARALE